MKVRTSLAAIFVQRTGATAMQTETVLQHRDVEPGEMHQLDHVRRGQQPLEVRAVETVATQFGRDQLHEMGVAVPGRELNQTQPVAMRIEAHRLGVDRNHPAEIDRLGQVVAVEMDRPFGMNCVIRRSLPLASGARTSARTSGVPTGVPAIARRWCPGEDSNFHDLAATGTLKPARLPIPPPGRGLRFRAAKRCGAGRRFRPPGVVRVNRRRALETGPTAAYKGRTGRSGAHAGISATRSVATVFGGSGFIGRYVVKRLAQEGYVVRVAGRDPERALFLKPMGGGGAGRAALRLADQ